MRSGRSPDVEAFFVASLELSLSCRVQATNSSKRRGLAQSAEPLVSGFLSLYMNVGQKLNRTLVPVREQENARQLHQGQDIS